jgi:hypothetical protein
MSEWNFVGAAYGLSWLGLASFGVYLARRWSLVRRRLDEVRTRTGGVR